MALSKSLSYPCRAKLAYTEPNLTNTMNKKEEKITPALIKIKGEGLSAQQKRTRDTATH